MVSGWQGGVRHGDIVMELLAAALKAADPYNAVADALWAGASREEYEHIYVVGAGKAGAAMALAAEDALGERVASGLVIVKDGHSAVQGRRPRRIEIVEAAHPVPDGRGVEHTARLLEMVSRAGERDLVLCLVSGGGSALLTLPSEGLTLADVQATTSLLLRGGATINELNAVRKHLSAVSGGQLARAAAPARVVSLILSDVIDSPLDVIASGPTAPDPTTYGEAMRIIERLGLSMQVPSPVVERLMRGEAGELPETPKPGDPVFERVENRVVASNVTAVDAGSVRATELGLNASVMSTSLEGEAREVGTNLARVAREVRADSNPEHLPVCLLFGGETTVTVRGSGVGGRNTELALAAALALDGAGPELVVASFATDGGDGSAPAAGAIADGTTIERGIALGLDAQAALENNDSYSFWAALGDAIVTGPTGTNVNDIVVVLAF